MVESAVDQSFYYIISYLALRFASDFSFRLASGIPA